MQFSFSFLLTTLLTLLSTTHAYELRVFFQDGLEIRVKGDLSTPCQDFPPVVKGNKVNRITFDRGEFTNEFMVWEKADCQGQMVKRAGMGEYKLDPAAGVGSLKVM